MIGTTCSGSKKSRGSFSGWWRSESSERSAGAGGAWSSGRGRGRGGVVDGVGVVGVDEGDMVGLVEDEDDLEDEDGGMVGFVEKDGFVDCDEEDGFKDPVAGGWGAGDTTGFAAATGAATEATAAAGATAAITGFTSTGEDSAAANLGFGAGLVGAGLGAADFAEDGFDTDLPPFDRSTGE